MNARIFRSRIRLWQQFGRYNHSTNSYFITTPIFYVNGPPHIGHLYTAVMADASRRWHLMKSANSSTTIFSTGTDEHGLKIQQAAHAANMAPLEYCNGISEQFQNLFVQFDVQCTDYIRTTEKRHTEAVAHFWRKLMSTGLVRKGTYQGWYSTIDEAYYSDREVTMGTEENGQPCKVSLVSGNRVELTEETNYIFALSTFAERLRSWLTKSDVIEPSIYLSSILSQLDNGGCADLSLSRDAKRVQWAITVPDDPTQKIYVWLDALVNYLTVAGYPDSDPLTLWPPDRQLLGIDIVRFHCIIWPALLMVLDLPLPKKLFIHGHWLSSGVKMSKSKGNVVDPLAEISHLSAEGLRYFLLRQGVPHDDANYSRPKAIELINNELANNLGNLVSRSTGRKVNRDQLFPPFYNQCFQEYYKDDGPALVDGLYYMTDKVAEHYDALYFYKGLQLIQSALGQTNAFYQYHSPWKHANNDGVPHSEHDQHQLATTVHLTYQTLRICGLLLQPIVPALATRLLNRLGIPEQERSLQYCRVLEKCPVRLDGRPLGSAGKHLFVKMSKVGEK